MNNKVQKYPRVIPVGETAVTVEYGDKVDTILNNRVHKLDAYLQKHPIQGITELVPTYRSLLVLFDPAYISPFALQQQLHATAEHIIDKEADAGSIFAEQLVLAGFVVAIDHGQGVLSIYKHLSRVYVQPGDAVSKGALIGRSGSGGLSTGAHLHWEMRVHAVPVNPIQWIEEEF